jgi:hypothetical protein
MWPWEKEGSKKTEHKFISKRWIRSIRGLWVTLCHSLPQVDTDATFKVRPEHRFGSGSTLSTSAKKRKEA